MSTKSLHRLAQFCAHFILRSKSEQMVQFFDDFAVACCRISVIVQRCLQLFVPCLLPYEIRIDSVIEQHGNVGLPQFVWRAPLYSQFVTHSVELHLDVVLWTGVKK